jgi:hypothetical protein
VVGLFFGLLLCGYAQSPERAGVRDAKMGMERIDAEEGARRLNAFREQRLQGDYVFDFQLEHKPRKARTVRYDGIMWGSWNEHGAITRFEISTGLAGAGADLELLIQNGREPKAWRRRNPSEDFKLIKGKDLFQPLLPGLVYSVFDLQMPFIFWDNFIYEGPSLVGASRVAQRFLMIPPEGSESARQGISGVRVSLDDTYNALWRVEVLDEGSNIRSKFSVESFKKVQEQYIVKRITLVDYPSKDRTTFKVLDASVGLKLDGKLFEMPDSTMPELERSPCCDVK